MLHADEVEGCTLFCLSLLIGLIARRSLDGGEGAPRLVLSTADLGTNLCGRAGSSRLLPQPLAKAGRSRGKKQGSCPCTSLPAVSWLLGFDVHLWVLGLWKHRPASAWIFPPPFLSVSEFPLCTDTIAPGSRATLMTCLSQLRLQAPQAKGHILRCWGVRTSTYEFIFGGEGKVQPRAVPRFAH